jgi:hypothetical protein
MRIVKKTSITPGGFPRSAPFGLDPRIVLRFTLRLNTRPEQIVLQWWTDRALIQADIVSLRHIVRDAATRPEKSRLRQRGWTLADLEDLVADLEPALATL